MLNQASTDRAELAKLLNISQLQMSYITDVNAGHGLIKVNKSLIPFENQFPKDTELYRLMTTKNKRGEALKPKLYIAHLSGGKDSTAMLLRLLEEKKTARSHNLLRYGT